MPDEVAGLGLGINVRAATDGVEEHLTEVREALMGLVNPLRGIHNNLKEVGEAFVAAFAVERIHRFIEGLTEANEKMTTMALLSGLPLDQVAAIDAAAESVGVSGEEVARAFVLMGTNISNETVRAKEAMRTLGLSMAKIRAETPINQLLDVGHALANMTDVSSRNAVATAIMGRGYYELASFLALSKEQMQEWLAVIADTGDDFTRATTALDQTKAEIVTLGSALQGDGIDMFMEFRGVLDGIYTGMIKLAEAFHQAMEQNTGLAKALDAVAWVLKALESGVAVVVTTWIEGFNYMELIVHELDVVVDTLVKNIKGEFIGFFSGLIQAGADAVHQIGSDFSNLGGIVSDVVHGHFGAISGDFKKLSSDSSDWAEKIRADFAKAGEAITKPSSDPNAWRKFIDKTKEGWDDFVINVGATANGLRDTINSIWETTPTPEEQKKPTNKNKFDPNADKNAKEALAILMAAYQEDVKNLADATKQKQDILDNQLKEHQISISQWLAGSKQALQEELVATTEVYNEEIKSAGLTAKQIEDIKRKEVDEIKKITDAMRKDDEKAAQDTLAAWKSVVAPVNQAINAQITPLLTGTENLRQAFAKMSASIIESLVQFIAKLIEAKVEMALFNTLLPGGSTVGGLVSSLSSLIPGLDVGAWSIPHDTPAVVHQGEMVVPAAPAQAFRQLLTGRNGQNVPQSAAQGSGETHLHFHGPVFDHQGFTKYLNTTFQNNPQLHRTLSGLTR